MKISSKNKFKILLALCVTFIFSLISGILSASVAAYAATGTSISADVYFIFDSYPIYVETNYNEVRGDGWSNNYTVTSSSYRINIYDYYSSGGISNPTGSNEYINYIYYKEDGKTTSFGLFNVEIYKDNAGKKGDLVNSYSTKSSDADLDNFSAANLSNGDYIIEITCVAACQGTLKGVTNGGRTNGTVSFTWSGSDESATLDGRAYTKGTEITAEGEHTIILKNTGGYSRTYTFTIDKTAPTGTLSGVTNGGRTNTGVTFSWTDSLATAKLNGSTYTKGSQITNEGSYTLELTDDVGNSTTYTFTIDKTAPVISMFRSDNNTKFSDGVTLNCYPYFSISDSDIKSVIISDGDTEYDWTKETTQTVYFDTRESEDSRIYYASRDALIDVLKEKERKDNLVSEQNYNTSEADHIYSSEIDYAYVGCNYFKYYYTADGQKGDYYIFFNDSVLNTFIDSNINSYVGSTNKTLFLHEGEFTIKATDIAGNITERTFTVDLTAPTSGKLDGVENGGKTNGNVSFTWGNDADHATLNNQEYSKGSTISENGKYTIALYDAVGNFVTYTFEIDKTAPTGTLSGVTDGGRTNTNVSFSWKESGATATLNSKPYESGTVVSDEGDYTIVLTDDVGNSTTYTFTIDKTAPTGTLSGVTDGGRTNTNVSFSWKDGRATATLNKKEYTKDSVITENGNYELILKDDVGNSTTYTFTIDKTAPTGTLSGVTDGGRTNTNVSFSWTDGRATAKLDNTAYTKNAVITAEGSHKIVLTDDVGNSTTYTFTIDKTAPTGTLSGVANGGVTKNNVTFSWTETNATAKLDGKVYTKGTAITAEGEHTIVLTDDVGNSTTYTFEIDKTAPTGTLSGVTNGGVTKNNVLFSWSESSATATLDNKAYSSNTVIAEEGKHTIVLTDDVGNSTTYTFTIDKTAPTGTLSGVTDGGRTNTNVSFSWTEEGASATLNLSPYNKGTQIIVEGSHTIVLTDAAGNSSTYTFTIDKTPAYGEFSSEGNIVDGIYYFNHSVTFLCDEPSAYAELTFNKSTSSYSFGTTLSNDGEYELTLYDDVGNFNVYTFVIDTQAYNDNLNYLQQNYKSNISAWYETYSYKFSSTSKMYVADKYYSFTNYADTYKYAYNRERSIIESGTYKGGSIYCNYKGEIVTVYDVGSLTSYVGQTYYIYKSADNANTLKVYFNLANLEAALSRYAQLSITNKYIPNTPATPFPGDENVAAQEVMRDIIYVNNGSFKFTYKPSNVYLYINGILSDYSSTLSAGLNYIEEIDYAGNVTSYNIILDTEVPKILCSDALNNTLTVYEEQLNNSQLSTFYFSKEIVLSITDNFDEYCLMTITYNNITTYVIGTNYTCSESGVYKFSVYDTAGNVKSGTIYLSIEEPEIQIIENLDTTNRLESFNVNITLNQTFVQLSAIEVYLKTSDADDYVQIFTDNNSTQISISTLKYLFVTNGDYRIIISDNFGRTVTYEYSFVKAAPVGTLYFRGGALVGNNTIVNQDIYFTWSDTTCWAVYTFNGGDELTYNNKDYLSADGEYIIYLMDAGGNKSIYKITIDKTAPTGQLYYELDSNKYTLQNGGKTNCNVFFTYDTLTEVGATVRYTINGNDTWLSYNGEALVLDGVYTIELYDAAGNVKSYTFEIDTTPPEISIKDSAGNLLSNNIITNQNIKFSWDENSCTAILNGQPYSKNDVIYNEGDYLLQLTDSCGNFSICHVTIDKTAPTGTLDGVENGNVTNGNVTFSWTEEGASATLNGEPYESGTVISTEWTYTLILSDSAKNSTTYTFTIDKTAPTGTLDGVTNGNITNTTVTFTWTEYNATATLNGEPYSRRTIIANEGTYKIVLTDIAGNSMTYTFTIDKTAPTGVLEGVANGGVTNGEVVFSWTEEDVTATVNGIPFNSGTAFNSIGSYSIILTDKANNSTTYTFQILKTIPTGTLSGVTNGGRTNGTVSFTWTEYNATATVNGKPYERRTIIADEGYYTIILTDAAGNEAVYTFTIDKTAPTGTLDGVTNGGRTKENVIFSWKENTATAMLNGNPLLSGSEITEEGNHTIILTDDIGNSATYTFTIDKTAPTGTLSGVTNGGRTNTNVTFSWTEAGATATINEEQYIKGTIIDKEGTYVIVLTDDVGNFTKYIFFIDKTAPTGTLNGVADGGATNGNVTFSWMEEGASATLNGEPYESGTIISEEGTYSIVLSDDVNNSSTYTFIINKTAPTGTLLGVTNGGATYENVYFYWTVANVTATLNDAPYESGTEISTEGQYTIVLTDLLGNFSTYTFTIDKTAPTGTLSGVTDGGVTNGEVVFSWTEAGLFATLNGDTYNNGSTILDEGEYTIILTDAAGNSTTYTFSILLTIPDIQFSEDYILINDIYYLNKDFSLSFNEDIRVTVNDEQYNQGTIINVEGTYEIIIENIAGTSTIYTVILDKTAPTGTLNGVENGGVTNGNVFFYWTEEGASATLNDSEYLQGTEITEEGEYVLTLTDRLGNSNTYTFSIDRVAPTGTLDGVENEGTTNGNVSFLWTEDGATATLNGEPYESGTVVSEEGEYLIILKDTAGNITEYSFSINRTPPDFKVAGVEEGGITKEDVYFSWSKNYFTATLDGYIYNMLTPITTEGTHIFKLVDNIGNSVTFEFTIDKTAPTGTLDGVENGGVTNGNVTFSWTEAGATATLNGEPYSKRDIINIEGTYEIILSDGVGNTTTYTFTIDKTAPTGTLDGVENGGVTKDDVTFSWTETGATATLNGEPYESGTVISTEGKHSITLTDITGNSTTYTFTIDKTAPTGTLDGVENGGITNGNVTFSWTEAGATATLDGEIYSKRDIINTEGTFKIVLTDAAGNEAVYTFTIDKTAPTGTLDGIENGGATNGNVSFSWTEEGASATLNGEPYESGTVVSDEGDYTIVLTDNAGNTSTYTFKINITAPVISGIDNFAKVNGNVKVTWDKNNCIAIVQYFPFDDTQESTSSEYSENSYLTKDGKYIITVTDTFGNSSSVEFQIKKSLPNIQVVGADDNLILNEVKNNSTYSTSSGFTVTSEDGCNISMNDASYTGSEISDYGDYSFVVTDEYGNKVSFVISYKTVEIASENTGFGSTISDIVLCIIAGLVVVAIIVRVIFSVMKKKRKLRRK